MFSSIYLPIYLSVCLSIHLSIPPSIHSSIYLSINNEERLKAEVAELPDVVMAAARPRHIINHRNR